MSSGSSRAQTIAHLDNDYLSRGLHDGPDGTLTLRHIGADFRSCGVGVGNAIENDTDGSAGLIATRTESEIICTLAGGTNNTWTKGDQYSVYKSSVKDSIISTISVDRLYGRKVVRGDILNARGRFEKDEDLDSENDNVFGPGQPSSDHS